MLRKLLVASLAIVSMQVVASEYRVSNQSEYRSALKNLVAGDVVILANGRWEDFEIVFEGKGKPDQPIALRAETPGKVFITGQSNLSLAGEYLEVSGLVFRDGYTPSQSVIAFRTGKQRLANHSRITQTVIYNFTNPERFESDYWVAIYGRHNRFDHNHLEGKRNRGVTLAVRLDSEESQENYHRIDHNYFGPRPTLGSNGGETLRVGTSHFSRTNSFTTVENNFFDRCDGEVEIISSKSGSNIFRGNVFYESKGTLTLRHGHDSLVERNVFQGNGVEHTGGIRVINRRQTVVNNYLEGLTGYRFGGAMVVMNGVPNSPINRYDGVEDAVIRGNSLINSDHIQLAAGSDAERSAVPLRTVFAQNLIVQAPASDVFTVYDDISGISFTENVISGSKPPVTDGFSANTVEVKEASNGLLYPVDARLADVGASRDLNPVKKAETGTDWFAKPERKPRFDVGETIHVLPGRDTLVRAAASANAGAILQLAAGDYEVGKTIFLDDAITVKADQDAVITFERSALFEIRNGGSLKLSGLIISGENAPDYAGNSVIRTSRYSMLDNYEVIIENSLIRDLDVNRFFSVLAVSKGTMADRIEVLSSRVENVSGAVLKLNAETDDLGIYNADYVVIRNSEFTDIQGPIAALYRGGTDESTFGPHFEMSNSRVVNAGNGGKNRSGASLLLHGVQVTSLQDTQWSASAPIAIRHTVGEPKTQIIDNRFSMKEPFTIKELNGGDPTTSLVDRNDIVLSEDL